MRWIIEMRVRVWGGEYEVKMNLGAKKLLGNVNVVEWISDGLG